MAIPPLHEIGFTRKPKGHKGKIKLSVEDIYQESLISADYLFIAIDGVFVPFAIEEVEFGGTTLVRLEGVTTPEEASKLSSRAIAVEQRHAVQAADQPGELAAYDHLQGFQVVEDATKVRIGQILRIEEYPGQIIATVQRSDDQVLIPLIPQFIVETIEQNKTLLVNLPDGLLNL